MENLNLRDIREQHFISRRELALLAGVSDSSIVRIERGDKTCHAIADRIVCALSNKIAQQIDIDDVNINLYDVMRDRRQRHRQA